MEAASRTAFVTGGSGFIGGRLIERLVSDGVRVRALARSDSSAEAVRQRGAEPVRGDLDNVDAMREGAAGCEWAFHAAANVADSGSREDFERVNVAGTQNALRAAAGAGVRRFVHVGTEAALLAGDPLVNVDETAPLRPDSKSLYPSTKAKAEQAVRAANGDGLETVVVRPRFVWGPGDTTVLPQIAAAVRTGRFAWIGGGRHLTSTTHVDNVVHGLVLGAQRGAAGEAYFVTDGDPVVFREFVTALLDTQGLEPPDRSIPAPLAGALAAVSETLWGTLPLPGGPPLTRMAYWAAGQECTIDISRARSELGYEPVKSLDEGLAELRAPA
ncbi:MAG TPA: NAD-dependent epimerase/dehydratase family protein [Thermoleophilaceae bacterium]